MDNSTFDYKKILQEIQPLYKEPMGEAQARMDEMIKPLGSFGKLEKISVQLAGITGKVINQIHNPVTIIMAADNGICGEGVSGSPQDITYLQTVNMTKGITGIGVLSSHEGSDLHIVDVGIMRDVKIPGIFSDKVMYGTHNFAKGAAMSREEAEKAIQVGIKHVWHLVKEKQCDLLGTGEMGIGNTSSSGAIAMVMTGASAEEAIGKGGGLTDEALKRKKEVLTEAINHNGPKKEDPIDVLAKVGGLDIAGLVGCYIGAAYYRVPIVVDGLISAVSALIACRLNPLIRNFLIASHRSMEPAYDIIAREIGLKPMLDMEMRLGEGTGCPLAFHLIKSACSVMANMATFKEIQYDESFRVDIREGEVQ